MTHTDYTVTFDNGYKASLNLDKIRESACEAGVSYVRAGDYLIDGEQVVYVEWTGEQDSIVTVAGRDLVTRKEYNHSWRYFTAVKFVAQSEDRWE